MEINTSGVKSEPMLGLARSYTMAYSVCYLASPFLGLQVLTFGRIPSALALIAVGLGLFYSVYYQDRKVMGALAVGESIACVAHYLQIVPWAPTFSDTAYIIMALLDLIQSMCLFKMMERS